MDAIRGSDLGFIDPKTNQVRSKKELKPLDSKTTSKETDTSNTTSDRSVSSALSGVRSQVSTQISSFANVLNQNVDNLQAGKRNIKQLRATARKLKQAIDDGDEEKANKLREDFQALQSERDTLASKISEDNRRLAPDRNQVVNVGNDIRAKLRTDSVRFSKSSEVDLSSKKGINEFLRESKAELDDIKVQLQDEKAIRKEARALNKSIRNELNVLGQTSDEKIQNAISDIEEAGLVAESIAAQVGSQATLEQSITSNVDRLVAENLLA